MVQVPQYEIAAEETRAQLDAEDCLQISMAVVHRYWTLIHRVNSCQLGLAMGHLNKGPFNMCMYKQIVENC